MNEDELKKYLANNLSIRVVKEFNGEGYDKKIELWLDGKRIDSDYLD